MQPNLDFFKKRTVLLKVQAAEGTPESLSPSTDGFRLFDGQSNIEHDVIERPEDKPHLGHDDFALANARVSISGLFELWAPAEPGQATNSDAWAAIVLLPAGMTATKSVSGALTRYNPISQDIPVITGHWYHTRELIKSNDIRVDISSLKMEIGQRFSGQAALLGELTSDVEESTPPSVTLPTKVPVVASKRNSRCRVRTLVRGGTPSTDDTPLAWLATWSKLLQVDFGNSPAYNEYTDKSQTALGRKGTFTWKVAETDLTDDFNPEYVRRHGIFIELDWTLWESDTRVGLYSVLGCRGKIETVTRTDINGDKGWEIKGRCLPSSAGNDEFFAGFGDNEFKLRGTLPAGVESVAYVATGLTASGDYVGTLTWAIASGALPTGLTINPATGVISGTPDAATAGSYTVTISATDDTTPTALVATKAVTFAVTA